MVVPPGRLELPTLGLQILRSLALSRVQLSYGGTTDHIPKNPRQQARRLTSRSHRHCRGSSEAGMLGFLQLLGGTPQGYRACPRRRPYGSHACGDMPDVKSALEGVISQSRIALSRAIRETPCGTAPYAGRSSAGDKDCSELTAAGAGRDAAGVARIPSTYMSARGSNCVAIC